MYVQFVHSALGNEGGGAELFYESTNTNLLYKSCTLSIFAGLFHLCGVVSMLQCVTVCCSVL